MSSLISRTRRSSTLASSYPSTSHLLPLHLRTGALSMLRCRAVSCSSALRRVRPLWSHLPAAASTRPHAIDDDAVDSGGNGAVLLRQPGAHGSTGTSAPGAERTIGATASLAPGGTILDRQLASSGAPQSLHHDCLASSSELSQRPLRSQLARCNGRVQCSSPTVPGVVYLNRLVPM